MFFYCHYVEIFKVFKCLCDVLNLETVSWIKKRQLISLKWYLTCTRTSVNKTKNTNSISLLSIRDRTGDDKGLQGETRDWDYRGPGMFRGGSSRWSGGDGEDKGFSYGQDFSFEVVGLCS